MRNEVPNKKVIIIGGGISGLATAYYLQKGARAAGIPLTFTLLEGEASLGGNIVTDQVDGFTVEGGPDCFLRQKPWAAQLAQELGLGAEIMGTNDDRRKVFVLKRGRLTPLPDGVMLIIPTRILPFVTSSLISWPGKIRMGLDLFIPPYKGDGDESVGDFVRRRLGKEALAKIAEPLMSGIHVSDPEKQSLLGTFPRFRALEQKHGSLIRGMLAQRRAPHPSPAYPVPGTPSLPSSIFLTLREGVGQLVQALEKALTDGELVTNCRVTHLDALPQGGFQVTTQAGDHLDADAVVLATPAFVSSALTSHLAPELSQMLGGIRYVSTATLSMAFRKNEFEHPLNGFGFVVPRQEARRVSACTWTSTKFNHRAPQDSVLLRCFVGGPGKETMVDLSDDALIEVARQELAELMGVRAHPIFTRIYRWHKANPQYDVGHLERVKEMHALAAQHPGLFITGGAYEGVGIPDCIRQGQQAAEKVIALLR